MPVPPASSRNFEKVEYPCSFSSKAGYLRRIESLTMLASGHSTPSRWSAVSVSCSSWTGFRLAPLPLERRVEHGAAGLGGQDVVEDELVAVRDQQLAGGLAVAHADHALVELAQLADEGREVAVAGDDDEGVDVLAAVGELHGVDRHLDVRAVLRALAGGRHLDQPEPGVHQLVAGVAVPAPVRVGALHDHAALLGQTVQYKVDVEVGSSLGAGAGHVLEIDQHGKRALALGQLVLQISGRAARVAAVMRRNAGSRAYAGRLDATSPVECPEKGARCGPEWPLGH